MKRGVSSTAKKLKTFNLDENVYAKFSKYCKSEGISMSKKIENFIKSELDKLANKQHSEDEHPMLKYT